MRAAYDGARTVHILEILKKQQKYINNICLVASRSIDCIQGYADWNLQILTYV